jgi:peptidoglycan/LPS O-acetylase OafA/YrhL
MEKHVPQLDGFRALACLLVLTVHLWHYPQGYDALNRLIGGGWIGVDLFFVLSGFLITRILLAARDSATYYRDFYGRRTLRIFPLYYAFLAFIFLLLPHVSHTADLARVEHEQGWYWLYAANFLIAATGWPLAMLQGTWSLAVEEQFYLIWPNVVRHSSIRQLRGICVFLIVACPILRGLLLEHMGWIWDYVATGARADALAWGALIALGGLDFLFARFAWPVLIVGSIIVLGALPTGHFRHESLWVSSLGYTLTGMTAAAGLWLTLRARGSLLASRPMREIGKVSYGLYLLHPVCEVFVSRFYDPRGGLGALSFLIVCGAVSFGVAWLSFHFFESPLLRLKTRFSSRPVLAAAT